MTTEENPGGGTGALESIEADLPNHTSNLAPAWIYDREDRERARLDAEARAAGYRLAVQCLDCKAWLTDSRSVAAHRGPVCRGRRGGAA